ncbi:TetR/AcrR family transcriptional regulator C-terminal domain-containing protein [Streptomyces sp. NPDC006662]|uniref:TetR/AcrR family transcriptional regulator C-terminal domain-containing protein n=1 Tax=Streptomyces sp. NPDC006662 TaxID=3156902 RepID=UPI0033FAFE11
MGQQQLEEPIRPAERGEVAAVLDQSEALDRGLDVVEEAAGEAGRREDVLLALEEEEREPEPGTVRPVVEPACSAVYRRHPWILTATGMRRQIMGPHQLGWLETALAALAGTGLSAAQRHDTFLLLVGHIRNIAQQTAEHDEAANEEWNHLTADVLQRHADRFPALTSAVAEGAFVRQSGDPLTFGLERILDGVAALLG